MLTEIEDRCPAEMRFVADDDFATRVQQQDEL
jgi:hypothetical protein